ncbi:MAG: ribose 5-phosphate isomerase B [Elusimicrobia bacterium]|nr:ribose 5-phosphate isomerase B [Elusimicrobiota bacterium]
MKIAIASDHAGYPLKAALLKHLKACGHHLADLGTDSPDQPVDYPDFAAAAAREMLAGRAERAIIVCGSGVGACVAANKLKGVRAGLCHDTYSAHQGVEHDDMNVLCLGSRIIGEALAYEIADAFVKARFSKEERHARRLKKVEDLEKKGN